VGLGWARGEEDLILTIFSRCRNSWLSRRHTQGQRAQLRCKYQRNIFTERNCAQHSRNKVPIPPHPSITHSILLCSRKSIPPPFWCPLFRVLLHKVFPQRRCGYIIDVCVCSIVCIVEREPSWWSGKTRGNIIRRIQFQNEKARNLPNEVYSSRKTLLRSFRDPVECNDLSLNSLSSVHPIHSSSQKKIKTF
jgi:hypothetical protein